MKGSVFFSLALIVAELWVTGGLAQNPAGPEPQSNLNNLATGQNQLVATFGGRYAGVKGHPFLSDEWTPGAINYSGEKSRLAEMKLDLYNQSLFVKLRNSVQELDLAKAGWESFVLETGELQLVFKMVEYEDKKGRAKRQFNNSAGG